MRWGSSPGLQPGELQGFFGLGEQVSDPISEAWFCKMFPSTMHLGTKVRQVTGDKARLRQNLSYDIRLSLCVIITIVTGKKKKPH